MNDITRTQRRTQGYWFVDGIAEIVGGVALSIVGALLYLSVALDNDIFATGALFGMILLFPATARVVRWAKDRITYPRTGFVKYPDPSKKRRGTSAVVALLVGIVFALVAVRSRNEGFEGPFGYALTTGLGVSMAIAFAVRAHKMSMPRFYVSALVVAAAAGWAILQGMSFIAAMGIMWIGLGITSVITGAIALGGYIHENPAPEGVVS